MGYMNFAFYEVIDYSAFDPIGYILIETEDE